MKMTGFAAGTLMAAAVFAIPASSEAQVRGGDVFGGRGGRDSRVYRDTGNGYDNTYRIGYDRGFEDGQKGGAKDRSRRGDNGLIHDSKYRKGDAGYKKSYGPRQDYIAGYRDGYEQAYRRGYRAADTRGRAGTYGRGRSGRRGEGNDPNVYGRDDRYGRDGRNGTDPYERDGRYGTDPNDPYGRDQGYGRDDRYGTDPYGRDDRYGRDPYGRDDSTDDEDGVIYEEPQGRW
jgi:hypothetical protein